MAMTFGDALLPGALLPSTGSIAAFQHLLDNLQLSLAEGGADRSVVEAYERYGRAMDDVSTDPSAYDRVMGAADALTAAMLNALENPRLDELVDDAVREFLREVAEGFRSLGDDDLDVDVDSAVALAAGMATIGWLRSLRSRSGDNVANGRARPDHAAQTTWRSGEHSMEDTVHADEGATIDQPAEQPVDRAEDDADQDEIVWQEFSVGEDGKVNRHLGQPVEPRRDWSGMRGPASGDEVGTRRGETGSERAGPAREGGPGAARPEAPDSPVEAVDRAYRAFVDGLRAAGLPGSGGEADRMAPSSAWNPQELERSTADLTGAYLRWAQGIGTVPELYLSYARFVGLATELIERQLRLVQEYEHLLGATLRQRGPASRRDAAQLYERFVAEVRNAWSDVDPTTLPPEQLAAMTARISEAAEIHRRSTETGPTGSFGTSSFLRRS